ncbi:MULTISPECIES: YjzD family protein [Bacillus]|uniref:YjzD family protein n=1 Tax=Bacillus vallismortis TaxID=72361 RepID=A0AAP3FU07_BACVA|nr:MULTISPECIES: YjzD family protein [Bacillus]MBG9769734.1 membrane protein [Bacillus vallismortis]MCY7916521.1 YjzD family protein [Bacillus vallismortis]MCY8307940.1 YjzD family protein [Bacillus vallismortis]MCY8315425.1 YjzD family protein [Bacillus vallismortis]MCY8425272.1 YjzD family protein [Bacillus vallismortis]
MRYIIAFIWTFLLSHMACYLIASMNSVAYQFNEFKTSSVIAVILYVLIMVLAEIMPMNKNADQH